MSYRQLSHGFEPVARADASTLILGSLPSQRSLETGEYFANPRNVFWRVMGALIGAGADNSYAERTERLIESGFAIWDVLESAHRPGSLDSAIDSETASPNDFACFFREHPDVRRVCFNGQKAAAMFERWVMTGIKRQAESVEFIVLPSTSPAHAAMTFEEKLEKWSIIVSDPQSSTTQF